MRLRAAVLSRGCAASSALCLHYAAGKISIDRCEPPGDRALGRLLLPGDFGAVLRDGNGTAWRTGWSVWERLQSVWSRSAASGSIGASTASLGQSPVATACGLCEPVSEVSSGAHAAGFRTTPGLSSAATSGSSGKAARDSGHALNAL